MSWRGVLSRELDAIEAINAILEKTSRYFVRVDVERHDGPNVERVFKPVIVREVELDVVGKFGGGRHLDLDLASKFSIAPGFIEALVDVGLGQATQASLDLVAEKGSMAECGR